MPSWGKTLPASAAYLPIGPQPILGHVAYNYTEGLFCPTSPSALKNQLTAIPSPPVAEEKGEHSGDVRELSEDSV